MHSPPNLTESDVYNKRETDRQIQNGRTWRWMDDKVLIEKKF